MLCTVLVKFNNSILRNILDKQEAGDGVIVFVASQAALIGIYGLAAYCGSKYAVRGFAEALAMEVCGGFTLIGSIESLEKYHGMKQ